jgi:virginiamycin B lyase
MAVPFNAGFNGFADAQIRTYGMPIAQQNDVYQLEFGGTSIRRRDAKTGEVTIRPTPFSRSRLRRGRVEEENRQWFAEYGGNGIAIFDPSIGVIKEWTLQTSWSAPYGVAPTKCGEVWTGSMLNNQVARLNAKTNEIVEYLLSRSTNIRRVFVDDTSARLVLRVGSNHGAPM